MKKAIRFGAVYAVLQGLLYFCWPDSFSGSGTAYYLVFALATCVVVEGILWAWDKAWDRFQESRPLRMRPAFETSNISLSRSTVWKRNLRKAGMCILTICLLIHLSSYVNASLGALRMWEAADILGSLALLVFLGRLLYRTFHYTFSSLRPARSKFARG